MNKLGIKRPKCSAAAAILQAVNLTGLIKLAILTVSKNSHSTDHRIGLRLVAQITETFGHSIKETDMLKIKFARIAGLVASVAVLSGILSFAQEAPTNQKTKRLFIQASAQGTSTQLGRMVSVNIIINEYSTANDQQALMEAFEQNGSKGLYHAVEKMSAKGRIAITGTLGYDLNYIRLFPMPDGGRKIRFVTDRPIAFGEAWGGTRSMDYNISAGEIILSKQKGKSSGTLLPACQLKLDKNHGLEIEAYQNPWKLENIMLR